MRKTATILGLILALLLAQTSFAATRAETKALATVKHEMAQIRSGRSRAVAALGAVTTYARDFKALLQRYPNVAEPKTVFLEEKPVKILIPLDLGNGQVGGFFQVSPDGKTIQSYLPWDLSGKPLFRVSADAWAAAKTANDVQGIDELLPLHLKHSAGIPVSPSDLTDCFLLDHIPALPSKTQEEKRDYARSQGFNAPEKRRYGSLKCLGYAAALAADWWKIIQGFQLGSYKSFLTGAQEYGTDPRMLESLYFSTKKSPYSLLKYNVKKDLVTGEKVPYSPKHYAYVLSCIPLPKTVADPMTKKRYTIPHRDFGMERPFFTVFNHSKGKIGAVRQALKSYGVLLGQHTMRIPGDKKPLKFIGIHSILLVGVGKLKGKDVVLYYETFGKNHRDYLEDGFYGPALRAFPVGFFFQGIAFPHSLKLSAKVVDGSFTGAFSTGRGQKTAPDKLAVSLNGRSLTVKPGTSFSLPLTAKVNIVKVHYRKQYFQTPEEPLRYTRTFVISGSHVIELGEYEQVCQTLASAKLKLAFWRKRKDGYRKFLRNREEGLRTRILKNLGKAAGNSSVVSAVQGLSDKSPFLKKGLGRDLRILRSRQTIE